MNSIQELNNYGNQPITYQDGRASTVLFDLAIPVNQTVNIVQAHTFSLTPGINITEIINYQECATRFIVDTRNLSGVVLTWATMPAGVTLTESPAGYYTVSGLQTAEQWEAIKSPTVSLPSNAYVGNFVIASKIDFLTRIAPNLQTWTTAVSVRAAVQLTEPEDFYYDAGVANALTGTPTILDELDINPATWTVTVTSNDNTVFGSLSTAGTGGTSTWNAGTYTLTITGTKTQVNSHLGSLTYTAPVNEEDQFELTYTLTNSVGSTPVIKHQSMYGGTNLYFYYTRGDAYYNEDTPTTINNGPLISDVAHAGDGTYTLTIGPNIANAVASMSSTGTGGTSSWNNTTKVLTITGTRDQCNDRINNLTLTPATDYRFNFKLNYTVAIPTGGSGTRTQRVNIAGTDADIVNMNITRYYYGFQKNMIFATATPEIVDSDPNNPTYTIFFNTTLGYFAVNGTGLSQNWSYSGTKAQVNALFSQIEFYPLNGIGSTGSFTYTQKKGTTTMVTMTVGLYFVSNGTPVAGNVYVFSNSTTWAPPPEQSLYLKADVLAVGGGGGGGFLWEADGDMNQNNSYTWTVTNPGLKPNRDFSAGGGGGGGVSLKSNLTLNVASTCSITVGSGGAGAYNTGGNYIVAPQSAGNGQSSSLVNGNITVSASGGGGGGQYANYAPYSGFSPGYSVNGSTPTQYNRLVGPPSNFYSPGGSGAGGQGNIGTYNANIAETFPGIGGSGITSNITGSNVVYGAGAAGWGMISYTVNQYGYANSWTYGDGTDSTSSGTNYGSGGHAGNKSWKIVNGQNQPQGRPGTQGVVIIKFHS